MLKQFITASDVTDGGQRSEFTLPWQSECENRTATWSDISVLVFVWLSVGCCFCVHFGLFSGDLGFSIAIHIRIYHYLSSFFPSVG